jgi:hypothetical protein
MILNGKNSLITEGKLITLSEINKSILQAGKLKSKSYRDAVSTFLSQ